LLRSPLRCALVALHLVGCAAGGPDLGTLDEIANAKTKSSPAGAANALAVSGDIIYAASQYGVRIFKLVDGNPAQLTTLVDYEMNPPVGGGNADNAVRAVRLAGKLLLIGGRSHVYAVDVSDPAAPKEVAKVPTGEVMDMVVSGNLLAVVDNSQFYLFSTASPAALPQLSKIALPGFTVLLDGNKAYVAGVTEMTALDISNPEAPKTLGTLAGSIGSLEVSGTGYLFNGQGTGSQNRSVIDVRDPAAMKAVPVESNDDVWRDASHLKRVGNTLYAAGTGLRSYNVGDPLKPKFIGAMANIGGNSGIVNGFEMANGKMYIAHREGLSVFAPK
jgi:hypothetical protein